MRTRRLLALVPPLVVLGAWGVGALVLGERTMPGPIRVLGTSAAMLLEPVTWAVLGYTTALTLVSFASAAVAGVLLGILPGRVGPLRAGTDATVDFLRSIPGPALLPVFMTLFGLFAGPKIALATFVCTLVNAVYTSSGIKQASRGMRVVMAESFGAGPLFLYRRVILPGALESIVGGLRVTLSLALVLSVVAELVLMTGTGLGVEIRIAYEDVQTTRMYALIVLSGVLGTALNAAFNAVERRVAWYRKAP